MLTLVCSGSTGTPVATRLRAVQLLVPMLAAMVAVLDLAVLLPAATATAAVLLRPVPLLAALAAVLPRPVLLLAAMVAVLLLAAVHQLLRAVPQLQPIAALQRAAASLASVTASAAC